jgi:hypothetical protein
MSPSSKQRSTWAMASHLADIGQELVAQPLALGRARTRPAISTKVMRVGMICLDPAIAASLSSRGSGTATSPTFGSMVQKGKFAACAAAVRVSALNSVDLPTFGSPTIPILKPMAQRVFDLLADGGAVIMPFAPTFWSDGFGMLKDRFGTHWMVSAPWRG